MHPNAKNGTFTDETEMLEYKQKYHQSLHKKKFNLHTSEY